MYLGCADRDAELLRRSRLFARLEVAEQVRLLLFVLHNDQRGHHLDRLPEIRAIAASTEQLDTLTDAVRAIESVTSMPPGLVDDVAADLRNRLGREPQRWPTTWCAALTDLADVATDRWCLSSAFGAALALAGQVPCPAFAFGRWHLHLDEPHIRRLVELACCYAYRLVKHSHHDGGGAFVGQGAYSISTRDGPVLTKAPLNLAARDFMLQQEARLLTSAAQLSVAERLPRLIEWDPDTSILRRDYIAGPTGHSLLAQGEFQRQPRYVRDLEHAHEVIATDLRRLRVHLDLHPANFVWHAARQQWVLIDAGPVPVIGSDYYDIESFDTYLQAVWLDRLDNMRDEPVRSLDWEPLLGPV